MTEIELEILRLRLRAEVHQVLLRGLYTGLANISPALRNHIAISLKSFAKSIQKS
jgi:hypothetical protein